MLTTARIGWPATIESGGVMIVKITLLGGATVTVTGIVADLCVFPDPVVTVRFDGPPGLVGLKCHWPAIVVGRGKSETNTSGVSVHRPVMSTQ